MRTLLFSAVIGAAIAVANVAGAQTQQATLANAATQMYDTCVAAGHSSSECACMAGFYGGRLQPDEFSMIAVLNGYVDVNGAIADMPAAQRALRAEAARLGLSDQRFQAVMQRFGTMAQDGAYGDQICMPLRGK